MTEFKPAAATPVQGARPLAVQCGVNLDGSLRAGSGFGWALAANPGEPGAGGAMLESIHLPSGAYAPLEIDLALPAQVPWRIGRTFNPRQEDDQSARFDSDGYQGRNWFQISQPELLFYDADDNPATKQEDDLIYLVDGADRYAEFRRTGGM